VAFARVCVRIVSKGIRFVPAVATHPDRDLGEARAALDRGDGPAALKSLDRARRGYLKAHDADGLEHVLDMAALVDSGEERSRVGRDNLAYAVKQNLRQESRRSGRRGETWVDPYPDLQAPAEHTGVVLTRTVKIWIGVGVLVVLAGIGGVIAAIALVDSGPKSTVSLRLLNDTRHAITVRGCSDSDCISSWSREVPPGQETDTELDADVLVAQFKLKLPGPDECLPVRVHDGYLRLKGASGALAVKLSLATSCPGTTVLPAPTEAAPTPL
jgi:hypothetical protein